MKAALGEDPRDLAQNLFPALDRARRFELLLERDDVLLVLAAAAEQLGERVEGDLVAVNQKGETLIAGSFAVALPSRGT